MHVLCLQVAVAAGDCSLDFIPLLMTVVEQPQVSLLLQWAATTKSILALQPSSAAIQRGFSLVNSAFT